MKFLLASLKTLTNSKNCCVSRIKFLFSFAVLGSPGRFFPAYIHSRISEQFQDHMRVTELLLLETQAAIKKPEQAL